jgi:endonuclease-3
LSAQCTDKRVNTITPALFKKYKTAKAYAGADIHQLEELVFQTGFYRAKARHIKGIGIKLTEEFNEILKNLDVTKNLTAEMSEL